MFSPDNFGRFLKNWSKLSFFSIALLIIILISLFYVVHRSALYEEGNNEGFVMATGVNLTETGYMGGIVFTQKGLNVEMLIVLSVIVFLTLVAGLIMLKLALKIAKTLKNRSSVSETITRLQKKVFTLLLYQVA